MANGKNGKSPQTTIEAAEHWLERFARSIAIATGRSSAFLIAVALVLLWAAAGPFFGYSVGWQAFIGTGTAIVTFLMVFLIQRAQNLDTMALQVKLAELIIAMEGAKNEIAVAEKLTETELAALHEEHSEKAEEANEIAEAKRALKKKAASVS